MIKRVLPLVVVVAGCQQQSDNQPATALRPAPATVSAEPRLHPVQPQFQLRDSAAEAAERAEARALGIVYSMFADTLPAELAVLNDTSGEVRTVARVRFYQMASGGWADTIWANQPGLYGTLTRASHEEYGLQTLGVSGNWAQAIYAYNEAGDPQLGWVRLVPRRVQHVAYDSLLFQYTSDLLNPDAAVFYDKPEGKPVKVSLEPNYSLDVLQVAGEWIRIALAVPDTAECTGDPSATVARRDTVWVPRINKNGYRQLYSAVAGC